jgi:hypothetical protein
MPFILLSYANPGIGSKIRTGGLGGRRKSRGMKREATYKFCIDLQNE